MKRLLLALVLSASLLTAGCARTETFEPKPVTGVDAMFDESLGYYNEFPSVMELDGVRYVYYTRNQTKFAAGDTIAVRRGTLEKGVWTYGPPRVLLTPSESGWDSGQVYAPTVIKGRFSLEGKAYAYLMAYAGTDGARTDFGQIGLAVSERPDGGFVKLGKPFVTFDRYDYSVFGTAVTKGASEPSLVSYDGAGKAYLFYSCHTPSASPSTARCIEADFSDLGKLGQRRADRGLLVNTSGIGDQSEIPAPKSADWAYDEGVDGFVVVRDYYPPAKLAPAVAEAVQVVKADRFDALYLTDELGKGRTVWTTVRRKIDSLDTADYDAEDESKLGGYARLYSACLVRTAYGRLDTGKPLRVVFTSSAAAEKRPDDYAFTPALHELEVVPEEETA